MPSPAIAMAVMVPVSLLWKGTLCRRNQPGPFSIVLEDLERTWSSCFHPALTLPHWTAQVIQSLEESPFPVSAPGGIHRHGEALRQAFGQEVSERVRCMTKPF